MNTRLAAVALDRAARGLGEREPGYCQRWVRQAVQAALGHRYDRWFRASAALSAERFQASPPPGAIVLRTRDVLDTRQGDLLYCTTGHGGFGHVGIRVVGNRVAENSVVNDGVFGAIGFRPLREFGFDVVVRLPEP
ncbi:MAG TPA: hypothetical protein DCQ64_24020 [Candidatus Rokubacteria bacterium]|nr:hypothetical protein [Candidatus Rokubacteria bacterium]